MSVANEIQDCLQRVFSPEQLEIIDDSHQHVGHEGSKDGAGHFTVKIKASCFSGQTRIEMHRQVYKALNHLMPYVIHALRIEFLK